MRKVVFSIIGGLVMQPTKHNLLDTVGSLEPCTRQEVGCNLSCFSCQEIYSTEDDTETVNLVDAPNAFNKQNRQVRYSSQLPH